MSYEIFRAGTRTDANGNTVTITEADLAAAAQAYDPKVHEAPIVVGHPKADAPAYGWVKSLGVQNGVLTADFAQVDEGFADLVKAGRYKKVSASFYPPTSPNNPKPGVWTLRHVGFLGAQPPAVKGLSAISFAEGEVYVEFAEDAHLQTASLLSRFRDWFIGRFGLEEADKVLPDWQIEAIKELAAVPQTHAPAEFTESPPPPENHENKETPMSLEQELAAEKAAREAAEKKAAESQAELKKLQDEQHTALRDGAHEQNAEFAESLVKEGRLKPADKDLVVKVLDFAEYPDDVTADFGEGSKKQPLSAALRAFFTAVLPKQIQGGEMAKGETPSGLAADFAEASDPEALSHHQRALALAAKEGIPYEEAARRTIA
ncbi:2-oxoacid:acceptor oxidoreductase [Neisseria sicca]|jgi:putative phage associated protein|uniref:2-oxoacid:acceptor oxidoreductase n=1 Tax=Neisseria sicca TaxID=490 RepID=UPI000D326929|nr:2-oxoacid:acceptor oxidoreductase [Neisseria sicca]MBF1285737.1 2-oxoacid:acceptor oxidoreductase [Neisseria sp.]